MYFSSRSSLLSQITSFGYLSGCIFHHHEIKQRVSEKIKKNRYTLPPNPWGHAQALYKDLQHDQVQGEFMTHIHIYLERCSVMSAEVTVLMFLPLA